MLLGQQSCFSEVSLVNTGICYNNSNADLGGIGPIDQLQVVKSSTDGPTMIDQTYWLALPVGYSLNDHLNVCNILSFLPHGPNNL